MMMKTTSWWAAFAYSISAGAHAWFIVAPPQFPSLPKKQTAPTQVAFVIAEPEPPAPPPEPELPPEEPPPTPKAEPAPAPTNPEPLPSPANLAEPPPTAAPPSTPPPELTGTTLVAAGDGAFSAELGSGASRSGPVALGISKPAPKTAIPVAPARAPEPAGPLVEPLKDLLKRPVPPDLGATLKRNYPATARAQGKSGDAKVRARVDADGQIRVTKVVSESSAGFGTSCEKTLQQSRWSAPIDRRGRAVATWINYRCNFVVDR